MSVFKICFAITRETQSIYNLLIIVIALKRLFQRTKKKKIGKKNVKPCLLSY